MNLIQDAVKLFPVGDHEPMAYYYPLITSWENSKQKTEDHLGKMSLMVML